MAKQNSDSDDMNDANAPGPISIDFGLPSLTKAKEHGACHRGLTILFSVLISLLLLLFASFYTVERIALRHAPLAEASLESCLAVTQAHLWFEESMTGDSTATQEVVNEALERARGSLQAMLAADWSDKAPQALQTGPALRAHLEQGVRLLDELGELMRLRASDAAAVPGSPADERFDRLYKDFIDQMKQADTLARNRSAADLRLFDALQGTLIIAATLLGLAGVVLIFRHERRRARGFKEIEEARLLAEVQGKWLMTTLQSMGDGVAVTDDKGLIRYLNPVAIRITGWELTEAVGRPFSEVFRLIDEESGEDIEDIVAGILRDRVVKQLAPRTLLKRRDGVSCPVADSCAPILSSRRELMGCVLVFQDVSGKRESEARLERSVREKELMLREIHHRVKNNLQVVTSLLGLQSANMRDSEVRRMLEEARSRVHSMALIHDRLYKQKDLAAIEMREYLDGLAMHLFQVYDVDLSRVRFVNEVGEQRLGINTAIPVGLCVSELIANSLKHAFADHARYGEIRVECYNEPEVRVVRVQDDGPGFPAEFAPEKSPNFGLHLARILAGQLKADIRFENAPGARITLRIPNAGPDEPRPSS